MGLQEKQIQHEINKAKRVLRDYALQPRMPKKKDNQRIPLITYLLRVVLDIYVRARSLSLCLISNVCASDEDPPIILENQGSFARKVMKERFQ